MDRNYTKTQIKNYLIDCIGYSEIELQGTPKEYLLDLVEDKISLNFYTNS